MKMSEVIKDLIVKIKEIESTLKTVDNTDPDFEFDINFYFNGVKKSIFNNMVKYEYAEFYLKNKNKLSSKKFVDNPEKIFRLLETQASQD